MVQKLYCSEICIYIKNDMLVTLKTNIPLKIISDISMKVNNRSILDAVRVYPWK